MKEDPCPYLNTCFISSILRSIEVPQVLSYCYHNYLNCRYYPRPGRGNFVNETGEEARG